MTMVNLETVINNLPVAIFVVDRERRIALTNRLAQDLRCFDQQTDKKQRLGDMLGCTNADNDTGGCGFSGFCYLCKAKKTIEQVFATQKSAPPFTSEVNIRSKGIRSLRMTVSYIPINTMPTSEAPICLLTVVDMTDMKKKERLAAATETIGAICHELNQPLQAIMGNVELLATYRLDDSAHRKIEQICMAIERIKKMNKQLMNITDYKSKPYLSTNILDIEKSGAHIGL
jgi:nitrogen fixation/metabolism regulation signal transduction histidine kinase